jgi:hypothetical protein
MKHISRMLCLCAPLCLISVAQGQTVNGWIVKPRVFNDYPLSTLAITNSNTEPDTANIHDSVYQAVAPGANRDDILASTDAGATALVVPAGQGFRVSTTFTLTDGTDSPRKEAGIRVNSPTQGDALFIVNSDAGEIAAFGAGAPFHLFGNKAGSNGYTTGTPITLTYEYDPPAGATSNVNPGSVTYTVSYPTLGLNQSFSGAYSNNEGGPVNVNIGVYAQGQSGNATTDFINANFATITAVLVPEPASLGLVLMGATSLLARRRSA